MFRADLRRRNSVEGPHGLTLLYAHTGFHVGIPFGGGGYVYSHPVAVRHESTGVEIPIRDHVMALRMGLLALVVFALMLRWINGR